MIEYVDDCYGCDWPTCTGCPYQDPYNIVVCDDCGKFLRLLEEDSSDLYADEHLCEDCEHKREIKPYIDAAKLLQDYCTERGCDDCPFKSYDDDERLCLLNMGLEPANWYLEDVNDEL